MWVRFVGVGGTQIPTSPVGIGRCGADVTVWYSEQMPTGVGTTSNGTVCFHWTSSNCQWNSSIAVTNCGSYYVYQLSAPPVCNSRYCTDMPDVWISDTTITPIEVTTSSTPIVSSQCYNYTLINDPTSSVNVTTNISVIDCGSYYVYQLCAPPGCALRYCTDIPGVWITDATIVPIQVSDSNSLKLQSLSLAQFSGSTNQLTRTALMLVSNKCYQLSLTLRSMATLIAYEDVQIVASQLIQCATNILSAVNGPLQERTLVLDLDSSRATAFPTDYDTDLESEWSNPNLFANGNDFSWKTIEEGRNTYYQKQLATTISNQMNELISLLTSTLNIHINIGQNLTINTPSAFMSLETISIESLSNRQIQQVGNAQINIPKHFNSNINDNSAVMLRSRMEPLAAYGSSKSQSANTNVSTSISLSVVDRNGNEVTIKTDETNPIEIIIPHDPSLIIPSMIIQNVTSINSTFHNQLFSYHYMNITNILPISVHIEINPLETNISYLFIYKFDQIPQLNTSINQIDGWTLFCSLNLTNESIYTYFIDNQKTFGHQSIIFGLRELNSTEVEDFCGNSSIINPPITDEKFNFTSNYELRIYTSGCYYLDENNQWNSDGLIVGPLTNHYETQCFSTHLTTFASGFRILPESVNWNYVFANADFMRNKTIYSTIICVCVIYIILLLFSRYKDKKDIEKLGVTPLPDNHKSDKYFYQIIVFTGQRKHAGTKSKAVNGPLQERTLVLDLDSSRATNFPDDYDTDIESEWSNLNLFANGNDFSWKTIEKGRNTYYQQQLANTISNQTNEIISLLTSTLNIHINIGQNLTINTPSTFMSLETISIETLSNKQIQQVGNAQINIPEHFNSNMSNNSAVMLRSRMEPLAVYGSSKSQLANTNISTSISLSVVDRNGNEVTIKTNKTHPVEIIIPHDLNLIIPSMIIQNVISINSTFHNQSFSFHYINITNTLPISAHIEIHPLETNISYLFIYKFDQIPQLNTSINQIDGWTLFCSVNLTNESIYTYFINNQQTLGHQSIIFGLRELNSTETQDFCENSPIVNSPITDLKFNFTSNYELRIYTSGCYYLDENNQWQSDGLVVGPLTNHYETQCFSTHLTTFASGFHVFPESVNWNYVFANADFMKNKTIYLTIICVCVIYVILLLFSRYKDKKDIEKLGVTPLPDNHKSDKYFYQIIVFTGLK
ncbi:unnamed protein product [Adineta steineri]|uniref:UMOD/GP2/OIT3-like D8C domain-containing protein n=1 Tax=Adineta steineri TaxID=433720 RepID=A0A813U9J5_9BILA|nr:unnamed protein product [Adineta steineri]